jgi:outer membrane protein assembly factor BamB
MSLRNTAIVVVLFTNFAFAQEWTRFRGPNGSGQSNAESIPAKWSDDDYNWVVDLPGSGHSSPVVYAGRVFVQSADPETGTQYVLCFSGDDGRMIWKQEFRSDVYHIHLRNSLASASPAVDADHVYAAWGTPARISLLAFDHDGKLAWSRDDLGPYESQHGFGSSPIVAGDLVILSNQQMASDDRGAETSAILAFDRHTGELRWSTPRTSDKASYSVPCLHQTKDGNTELLNCSTTHGVYSLDLETGHENWSYRDAFSMRTVSSPVIVGDRVFGSTGSGAGGNYVVAVDLNTHELAYKIDRQAPYVPTVVAAGDVVILWSDQGTVACIDPETGRAHWTKRVEGNYSGSPVRVADKIFCVSDDGEVVALAADKNFKLLGRSSLGQPSRSTPAVSDGRMYLRTYSKLFSIGG